MPAQQKVHPFLMFDGRAEEAMSFYVSLIPGSEILEMVRYRPGPAWARRVRNEGERLPGGQIVFCTDSFVKHNFTFTPSVSIVCPMRFGRGGNPSLFRAGRRRERPDATRKLRFQCLFAWVNDCFGVSLQLNFQ